MSENFKSIILAELETLAKKETIEKNVFKVSAYQKVIKQLKQIEKIESWKDLAEISGIGSKIKDKIEEIFTTGKLRSAEKARTKHNLQIYDDLMKIHGVGPTKAKDLVENYSITSIEDLQNKLLENPDILNNKQKIGLKYYEDINLKIPRKEMQQHETYLLETLGSIDKNIQITIVGSYRRKVKESGDFDVLVTIQRKTSSEERTELMCKVIDKLKQENYIKSSLALGSKKFMGIVKLKRKRHARRMDILITSQEEYPFAILYFTGSQELNILMRKDAIERGLRLNEYSLFNSKEKRILLSSEEEIFNKLGYDFIPPEMRTTQNEISKFKF